MMMYGQHVILSLILLWINFLWLSHQYKENGPHSLYGFRLCMEQCEAHCLGNEHVCHDWCQFHRLPKMDMDCSAGEKCPLSQLNVESVLGRVENLTANNIHYDRNTAEVKMHLQWAPPKGWTKDRIRLYEWSKYPIVHHCIGEPLYHGQLQVFFDDVHTMNDNHVDIRIPGHARDCHVTLQVSAVPRCSRMKGPPEYFTLDCSMIHGYTCPSRPYNPPGNVQDVKIVLIPGQNSPRARVTWKPPIDLGSDGVIGEYLLQFGELDDVPSNALFGSLRKLVPIQNMSIPGDRLFAEFDITANLTVTTLGLQIMACSPGHPVKPNGWISPILNIAPITEDEYGILQGQLLTDENGFIVVKIPDNLSVRVFWIIEQNKTKMADAVCKYRFRWGLYKNNNIREDNTVDVLKNESYLDLHKLAENQTYGIELLAVYNETDVDDEGRLEEQWDNATFHFFTLQAEESNPSAGFIHSTLSVPVQRPIPTDNDFLWKIMLAVSLVIGAIVIIIVVFLIKFKKRNRYLNKTPSINTLRIFYQQENNYRIGDNIDIITTTGTVVVGQPDKWEIPRNCVKLGEVLGEGAFGQVRKGKVKSFVLAERLYLIPQSPEVNSSYTTVAVKLLHDSNDSRTKQEFIKEINIMKELGTHSNVVSMIGCCTLVEPYCLIVEHMPNGDLLTYLKNTRNRCSGDRYLVNNNDVEERTLTYTDLLSFARQISVGMEFLSGKGYIHRDLAARNILLGDNNVLKIGDFGLARYIYDDKIYVNRKGGKLPLKWMSIESIFELKFSVASDVWSFGVVLYEIVTLGGSPYPTIDNKDILQELKNGYRMGKPENCCQKLYDIMLICWTESPSNRPSFTQVRQQLEDLIEEKAEVQYLQLDGRV